MLWHLTETHLTSLWALQGYIDSFLNGIYICDAQRLFCVITTTLKQKNGEGDEVEKLEND